ncbi:DUF3870 domain-containing protein [Clostridium sp. D2Q-14]|uniref:DUF3870 domain-containing protein n=1 Tax=Anaeromonas gelatinilytica TaxID=2683194 RepID=UPI00193B6E89|nr:DUF3870 domain-containing protein [Anaeromonas gelatinilytica]MBS4534724.1 DUF3870 domain-containing protein [Anaeromonas gelatinilytica]
MYDKNTVYIIGHGKTSSDNAITERFKIFFMGFVVDINTDEIVDLSCSATIATTSEFVASIFVGSKLDRYRDEIEKEVKKRYFGSSQKAIIVAYKDAVKKYREVKNKYC